MSYCYYFKINIEHIAFIAQKKIIYCCRVRSSVFPMPAFKSWVSSVTVKFSSIENNEKAPAHFQSVILS